MVVRMKLAAWIASIAVAIMGSCSVGAEVPEEALDQGIIVIDEEPAAFFERAPRELSRKMRATVRRACEQLPADTLHCTGIGLLFLREVSELGRRTQSGYVCVAEDLYLRNRYFAPAS